MLYDVELLFCTVEAPDLMPSIHHLTQLDPGDRTPHTEQLFAFATSELAAAPLRWTPHYDAALRVIVGDGDELFADVDYEGWSFGGQRDLRGEVDGHLRDHARAFELLTDAASRGARTLGDAFELTEHRDLPLWFSLVPDVSALVSRVHAALIFYLRATNGTSEAPIAETALISAVERGLGDDTVHKFRDAWHEISGYSERGYAIDALATRVPGVLWRELGKAPAAVFDHLGNPFRPAFTASAWL